MIMEFTKADIQDLAGIRTIWEEQFTTDSAYLNVMFGEIIPQCSCYICKDGTNITSALSLMPMHFIDDTTGIKLNGWYMFGVATLREYWGKRLAAQTIEFAISHLEKDGYNFIFERPATQDLNSYYSKLGFSKALEYIPHTFRTPETYSSTGNISEIILEDIRNNHPKRFEWGNITLLESLIKLGELDFHNATYCNTPPLGTFISIKTLNGISAGTFNDTFFCFPME